MKLRLLKQWQLLRESLWFVPGLLVLLGLGAAMGLVRYDAQTTPSGLKRFPLFFGIGADASRNMLTAIAGSMLTVATLAFSVTLAALSQISNQYSPRVLRNFMRDEVNQVIMGYFVGVFAYCLAVLGTIRGADEGRFVPSTAVLGGLLLALGGVAALIFFIHHMAESLQTGTLVRHITNETIESLAEMFPAEPAPADPLAAPSAAAAPLSALARRLLAEPDGWDFLPAPGFGYLQRIDVDGLVAWASCHGALLRLNYAVGAFVGEGAPLFCVRADFDARTAAPPPPGPARRDWPLDLMQYVSIGRHRNIEQDVAFGLQQLVDIALKALSIGINDTTTAIMAIDHLGEIGARLARQPFSAPLHADGFQPRLLVRYPTFDEYMGLAFNLVRVNARGNFAVLRRLLRALALIAGQARESERKAVLRAQAALLLAQAEATLETDYEKQQVRALHEELRGGWD